MYPHLLPALESLYAFLFVCLREVYSMSIGNRGIDKILTAYRAQRVKERVLESPRPVSGSPYRSARQKPPTLPLSHAISVRAKWTRVIYRWWAHHPNQLINRWDVALAGLSVALDYMRWPALALIVAGLIATWLEGRSILRGRVLERRARMHKSLLFKALWQSAPVI